MPNGGGIGFGYSIAGGLDIDENKYSGNEPFIYFVVGRLSRQIFLNIFPFFLIAL